MPTTDWGSPETLEQWRQNWCELVNAKFAEKELPMRIDHRSYQRQGLELMAQVHEGPNVRAMERKGIHTEKGDYNRWVKATNEAIKFVRQKLTELTQWICEIKTELEKSDVAELPSLGQILGDYLVSADQVAHSQISTD